jgi:hypothetical protein
MRRWGLASILCVVVPAVAAAQSAGGPTAADVGVAAEPVDTGTEAPPQAIGYGALPGGVHVPDAMTLPKGAVEVITLDGFGYRKGLLSPTHTMSRTLGAIAVAYGVHDLVTIGLSLDGRYDRHHGPAPSPDDGYVGDPHVLVRAAKAAGTLHFGGQLGIWVPGKDAPSIAGSAISVDARALVSLPAGPGLLSFQAGFLFDNSAASVDHPEKYSLQDRVSLGVSDYNAFFGGAHLVIPAGKAWVGAEASIDAYLGSAPKNATTMMPEAGHAELVDGTIMLRGGVSGGFHINDQWAVLGYLELAKSPYVTTAQVTDGNIPLIPYEPLVTFGVGLSAKFGGPHKIMLPPEHFCDTKDDANSVINCPGDPILAKISGTVTDDTGKPVVGAKVAIKLKDTQPSAATDSSGSYSVEVPLGKNYKSHFHGDVSKIEETSAQIDVAVDGKKPATVTLNKLAPGDNKVEPIKLEAKLPPGQLTVIVHSLPAGKPVDKAVVTITGDKTGEKKVETDASGNATIELLPGNYKIKVQGAGFAAQELDVVIETNGVVIKNIDLRK